MSRTIVVAVLGASACSGETAFDTESGGGSTTAVGLTSGGDQATTTGAGVPTTGVVPPGSEATDAGETTASVTLSGAATGETTAGETTAGETTEGETTEGATTEGESTEGESTEGESTVGESTVGESTVGESTGGETTGEPFDPLLCGNGVLDAGETCDDGGVDPADDCSATCSEQKVVSVVAGQAHTCALLSAGKVKCWGPGAYGQLGLGSKTAHGFMPGDMGDKLPYVDLGGPAVALAAGDFFTCARLVDSRVKCWGQGKLGRLGLGSTEDRGDMQGEMGDALPAVDIAPGQKAMQLALGFSHACALLEDGRIKCWGHGPLGIGDNFSHGGSPGQMGDNLPFVELGAGLKAKQVGAGLEHTCALLTDGRVKCWGNSVDGQNGLEDTLARGYAPGQMGDNLPFVDFGAGLKAGALAVGGGHTCVLLPDGRVKCWGRNSQGNLGLGDTLNRGDEPGEMGDALPYVDLGTGRKAVQLTAMANSNCAMLDDGGVRCWGQGAYGVPGHGKMAGVGKLPGQMGDNLTVIDFGQGFTPAKLGVGSQSNHQCAVLVDGRLKCWGRNHGGYLGLGDGVTRGDNPGEMGDALPTVKVFNSQW